jgi:uncharacterized HAD superfamily protein
LKPCSMLPFVIACDLDEVLGQYLVCYIDHYNKRFGTTHKFGDFHSYDFSLVHQKGVAEISHVIQEFHKTTEFVDGYQVLPGAVEGVKQLAQIGEVHVVTARQYDLREVTTQWISKHFGLTQERLHMGNHYSHDGSAKRKKSQICCEIGAHVLIDDSLEYAIDVAGAGIPVILFDWEGKYGWNQAGHGQTIPPNIHRVTSWSGIIDKVRHMTAGHSSA